MPAWNHPPFDELGRVVDFGVINKLFKGWIDDHWDHGFIVWDTDENALNALESAIADRPYVTGDTFSAADVYVGSQITWGLQFGTIEERDSFASYAARVTDRDAYRRANEIDGAMG